MKNTTRNFPKAFSPCDASDGPVGRPTLSQQKSPCQFESQTDIGQVLNPSSSTYDDSQQYTISGFGTNMWFDRDEFHFVWKRLEEISLCGRERNP